MSPGRLSLDTEDGLALAARWWPAFGDPQATVVLVHGFSASKDDPNVVLVTRCLSARGFSVLTYDSRGHGDSEGQCTLGDLERYDVAAAVARARDESDCVILVGASMGAVGMLRYAAGGGRADGLVAVSGPSAWRLPTTPSTLAGTWLTQTRAGRRTAQRYLGVDVRPGWTGADAPRALARRVAQPLAVVHGRADRFIRMRDALELYRSASGPRKLHLVPGMGHAFDPPAAGPICDAVAWAASQSG